MSAILLAAQELMEEGAYAGVPTVTKDVVYHVGDLSKKRQSGGTGYEGDGLPVSEHPRAWSSIAQLGGRDLWHLSKKGGKFMNALAAMKNKALRSRVVAWATNTGWATSGQAWRITRWDDEWEQEVSSTFYDEEEARYEADDDEVESFSTLLPTPMFLDWWMKTTSQKDIDPSLLDDMLFYLFARDQTDLDGVWWNETLDVLRLSAPRGSIFQDRLSRWKKIKVDWDQSPDDDEDW